MAVPVICGGLDVSRANDNAAAKYHRHVHREYWSNLNNTNGTTWNHTVNINRINPEPKGASALFPSVPKQSLDRIPVPSDTPSQSDSATHPYYSPAIDYGGNPHNPKAWTAQRTQDYLYTADGGHRDLSVAHHFVKMNVEYDGNRTGVDLELSDGVESIECTPDQWRIQTKDSAHYNVAKHWPENVILVTSTFCKSGASRRLLEVSKLTYAEPDTIIAHGEEGLLGMGPPVSRVRVDMGRYKPVLSKKALDTRTPAAPTFRIMRDWKREVADKEKRGLGSYLGGLGDDLKGLGGDLSKTHSTKFSGTVHIPTSTPTSISPWATPGNKLVSADGIDLWDLGLQMAGEVDLGGSFSIDVTEIGSDQWFTGELELDGANWNLDFPIGLDFRGTEVSHSWDGFQIIEPVDLCAEIGCFAIENLFELGSFVQVTLNTTIDFKGTGKINMGANFTYANPKASWDVTDGSKNSASGWDGSSTDERWFNVTDGSAELTGAIGLDLTQFNGISLTRLGKATANVSLTDGVSIAVHATRGLGDSTGGSKGRRRSQVTRAHPRDILVREFMKRDTCASGGGTSVGLDLEEQVILQAGIGQFGTAPALWATQVPLYSTCIS